MYWNKKCDTSCAPGVREETVHSIYKICRFDCGSDYLLWDGTCDNNCTAPLVDNEPLEGQKYCRYKCADDEYLLWNGDC